MEDLIPVVSTAPYKVILIGNPKSGKTTFCNEYLGNDLVIDDYIPTLDVNIYNCSYMDIYSEIYSQYIIWDFPSIRTDYEAKYSKYFEKANLCVFFSSAGNIISQELKEEILSYLKIKNTIHVFNTFGEFYDDTKRYMGEYFDVICDVKFENEKLMKYIHRKLNSSLF